MRKILSFLLVLTLGLIGPGTRSALATPDPSTLTLGTGNYRVKQATTKLVKKKTKTVTEIVGRVYVEQDPDDDTLMHQYWVLFGSYKGPKLPKGTTLSVDKMVSTVASLDDLVAEVQDQFDDQSLYFESDVSVTNELPLPSDPADDPGTDLP